MSSRHIHKRLLREEEIEQYVKDLAEATDAGVRELVKARPQAVRVLGDKQQKTREMLHERMREAWAAEVVPARLPAGEGIDASELDRELMKKALAGLHAASLRSIALRRKLSTSGGLEDLASRIAGDLKWSASEVARLVAAENAREPDEQSSLLERLVPLASSVDLQVVGARLAHVEGYYIRVGIAKWFFVDEVEVAETGVSVTGSARSYRATVDPTHETILQAQVHDSGSIGISFDRSSVMRVVGARSSEVRDVLRAIELAADVELLGNVGAAQELRELDVGVASSTMMLLDLLSSQLEASDLKVVNLTTARFRTDNNDTDETSRKGARLTAVRFEGAHLLASAAACRLIVDGRSLVDVSLFVRRISTSDSERAVYPIRFAVERDHLLVMTSVAVAPHAAREVHRLAVQAAARAVSGTSGKRAVVAQLLERMASRATSSGLADAADILAEEDDDPAGDE